MHPSIKRVIIIVSGVLVLLTALLLLALCRLQDDEEKPSPPRTKWHAPVATDLWKEPTMPLTPKPRGTKTPDWHETWVKKSQPVVLPPYIRPQGPGTGNKVPR